MTWINDDGRPFPYIEDGPPRACKILKVEGRTNRRGQQVLVVQLEDVVTGEGLSSVCMDHFIPSVVRNLCWATGIAETEHCGDMDPREILHLISAAHAPNRLIALEGHTVRVLSNAVKTRSGKPFVRVTYERLGVNVRGRQAPTFGDVSVLAEAVADLVVGRMQDWVENMQDPEEALLDSCRSGGGVRVEEVELERLMNVREQSTAEWIAARLFLVTVAGTTPIAIAWYVARWWTGG